eukprot:CAMPEP_0181465976 /NCGR_PEP_ID=MMETSP1110-20121109/36227_1 /TAXON_ID=174948 /ORGANISM="Symbiodinium sp., Strain CCMP421" /LENGTH=146 /DNA_ID=CAMNT_0023590761 /DNA_START=51 /DNA_END=491 /DNA_ORIENTATION=+
MAPLEAVATPADVAPPKKSRAASPAVRKEGKEEGKVSKETSVTEVKEGKAKMETSKPQTEAKDVKDVKAEKKEEKPRHLIYAALAAGVLVLALILGLFLQDMDKVKEVLGSDMAKMVLGAFLVLSVLGAATLTVKKLKARGAKKDA